VTVIDRHYASDDRARSVYQYLDLDVPPHADALTVTLGYDRTDAIIDLGLVGPDRFGGWSGSERSTVTVTPTWATPGYVPGVVRGSWQVILGLHRVGPAGVTLAVGVGHDPVPRPAAPPMPSRRPRPRRRDLPATPGRAWLAADFHSHTVHSDGSLEIAELAVLAASQGLDVLAVTDHNTVSHHPHLEAAGDHAGLLLLPGQEVTTDHGHANCFGALPWIDFRQPPDTWRAATAAGGGVMAVNHPWAGECAWRLPLSEPAPLVEMWHSTWDLVDPTPLVDGGTFGTVPIGGSDFHRPGSGVFPGRPTTWVECDDRSIDGVLDALRHGRVAISATPAGPVLLRHDDELVAIDADGCELVVGDTTAHLTAVGRVVALAPAPENTISTKEIGQI